MRPLLIASSSFIYDNKELGKKSNKVKNLKAIKKDCSGRKKYRKNMYLCAQ